MSAHIEMMNCDASTYILVPGTEVGEDVITDHALVIDNGDSVLVVEGSPDELRKFGKTVAEAVSALP